MSRRVRHIQARPDEWIKVHRPRGRKSDSEVWMWLGIAIVLLILFRGC